MGLRRPAGATAGAAMAAGAAVLLAATLVSE